MRTLAQILVVSTPFVGALHTYAVSYGYMGLSREQSLHRACSVGALLSIILLILGVIDG